ncbi:hypothetical protein BCR44DRAFT_37042 [Catenaria anguillulae PL171]|uniref:CBS domain-containing protein n=1 Tax=Catenaria anguillulae PL171 TaxID=765915 RepID=A0A1Y2HTW6_9FUNG|nr:hypothetical protein BCR44DRAFT_37042 [Catenaria anguillulae PL171]
MSPPSQLAQVTFRAILEDLESQGRTHPPLVAVPPTATIKECLAVLARHNILSVPILSRAGGIKAPYAAMVSILDLVGHVFAPASSFAASASPSPNQIAAAVGDRLNHSVESALPLLGDASAPSPAHSRESYRVFERDVADEIGQAIQEFARGTHRMLLTSVAGEPTRVFSQSDLIRYIAKHLDDQVLKANKHGYSGKTTVRELDLHTKLPCLISVEPATSAREAFMTLVTNQVSAIPVLDPLHGNLVSVVSGATLRGFTSSKLDTLNLPVVDFLRERSKGAVVEAAATCTMESTLAEVLEKVIHGTTHRVWVVREVERGVGKKELECTGVISLTDVLQWIAKLE